MTTVRLWFTKRGEAAYISLLDLQRVMQRAFKRSGLPVWYTLGFNPHIYMTFAAPLSLGQESVTESLEFRTEQESLDWEQAAHALSACLPKGIDVLRVEPAGMDASRIAFAVYQARYAKKDADLVRDAFACYAAMESAPVVKKGKRGDKTVDLKQQVTVGTLCEDADGVFIPLECPAGSTLNVNPMLLLQYIEQTTGLPVVQCSLLRTSLLTAEKEPFV